MTDEPDVVIVVHDLPLEYRIPTAEEDAEADRSAAEQELLEDGVTF